MQRDPAIVPSQSDYTIVQCVQTGGAGLFQGNVFPAEVTQAGQFVRMGGAEQ